MGQVRNILFIMCDQLRWDYLSCNGHPTLATPHIDALAARGVNFRRSYCQSPFCGPSRMSFYTGRYMFCHGANGNNFPLSVHERTMGDYLRPLGLRTALIGKTHMAADRDGMARLNIDPASSLGVLVSECGFEPYERDDGLHPDQSADPDLAYNRYLRDLGYAGDNPWHDWANSVEGDDGEVLSGWYLKHSPRPARVKEEHSETAYMTDRALAFIDECGDRPWCAHLSYIKPHWPYIAPAPYHALYSANQILPMVAHPDEKADPHPVHAAFMGHPDSQNFANDAVRQAVIPAYMGLIKQIDDHVGRLMAELDTRGRLDDTMIVFTSDHGDYLGDHYLGEKELLHEVSARIPMLVVDPDPAADATRGSVDERLVEGIDLLPTFVEALGGEPQPHRLEGLSLLPLTRPGHEPAHRDGTRLVDWREAAFSECDYSLRQARVALGVEPADARAFMVVTADWKYVFYEGFRPQLFDLAGDPDELKDLGESPDPEHVAVRAEMHERLFAWLRQRRTRMTMSEEDLRKRTGGARKRGFLIGLWDEGEDFAPE